MAYKVEGLPIHIINSASGVSYPGEVDIISAFCRGGAVTSVVVKVVIDGEIVVVRCGPLAVGELEKIIEDTQIVV